jgi:hypothetical protein
VDVRSDALGREDGAWDLLVTLIREFEALSSPFAIGMADFIVGVGVAEVVEDVVGVVCTSIVLVV